MTYPETRRYDFDYWPPLPIEQPPITPAQSAPSEELCQGMLYIHNVQRLRAVYASGEWVDIQDFWLEAKPPKDSEMRPDYDLSDLDTQLEMPKRVWSRYHLSAPTYTFSRLGYELVHYALQETRPRYEYYPDFHNSRLYKLLFYKIFNQHDNSRSREHLLIARSAVTDVHDGYDPLPMGLGKEGHAIMAKVALRWSSGIQQLEAELNNRPKD